MIEYEAPNPDFERAVKERISADAYPPDRLMNPARHGCRNAERDR
jgi:hypothetical protein